MSKLQTYVKSLLQKVFKRIPIREEVSVRKLFPEYPSGRDFYDLVIPSLQLIIEVHGAQHEKLVSFGPEDAEECLRKLTHQKYRDRRKEDVARENNWNYLVIWYHELKRKEQSDTELLRQKLQLAMIERT